MEFVLWEKLAGLEGKELVMLIAAAVVAAALIVLLVCLRKRSAEEAPGKRVDTRALVYGALCISLSFVLSYIKLFSMPMGVRPGLWLHRRICIQPFADYPGRLDCASRAVRAGLLHRLHLLWPFFPVPEVPAAWRGRCGPCALCLLGDFRRSVFRGFRCGSGLRKRAALFPWV